MRTWAHWTAKTAMLAATFVAAGAAFSGAAFARTGAAGGSTSGSGSVLGGNQVSVPLSLPIKVCGNTAAVLGDSAAGCEGTATVHQADTSAAWSGGMLPGSPKTVPMQRLSAIQPAADSLIPGLATLPVMSALKGLPSWVASKGPAWQPSRGKMTVSRWSGGRGAAASHRADKAAMTRSAAGQAASRGLAILGAVPVVTGTPGLTNGAGPAALSALTTGSTAIGKAIPASTLTAGPVPGMGAASFYSLAIGALMAGAVALKMAGRRIRARKA